MCVCPSVSVYVCVWVRHYMWKLGVIVKEHHDTTNTVYIALLDIDDLNQPFYYFHLHITCASELSCFYFEKTSLGAAYRQIYCHSIVIEV